MTRKIHLHRRHHPAAFTFPAAAGHTTTGVRGPVAVDGAGEFVCILGHPAAAIPRCSTSSPARPPIEGTVIVSTTRGDRGTEPRPRGDLPSRAALPWPHVWSTSAKPRCRQMGVIRRENLQRTRRNSIIDLVGHYGRRAQAPGRALRGMTASAYGLARSALDRSRRSADGRALLSPFRRNHTGRTPKTCSCASLGYTESFLALPVGNSLPGFRA